MIDPRIKQFRNFLKDDVRLTIDFRKTDQRMGKRPPAIEKPYRQNSERIDLVPPGSWQNIQPVDIVRAIENRKSRRVFTNQPLTMEDLSFLLWATQGIRKISKSGSTFRTVPSAGARHSFETYLCVLNVENLSPGLYRYLPINHQIILEQSPPKLKSKIIEATYGQGFVGKASVLFIWTTLCYRMEWRYGAAAHKVIAIDSGHVCQNLYLAAEAIKAGTCAIAAYHQELTDRLLNVDGEDEFTIYMAAVGKRK